MSGTGRLLQAFLDESQSNRRHDPHTYVLAAGICSSALIEPTRASLAALRLPGQHKLHWRDESEKRRHVITEALARMPLQHIVVVRDGRTDERPERQRRHCLERMLFELDQLEVATATFESRGPHDDRRDRDMLDALRAQKTVTSALRMDHRRGQDEAMLWAADAVCGVVTQQRVGRGVYLAALAERVTVNVIPISAG